MSSMMEWDGCLGFLPRLKASAVPSFGGIYKNIATCRFCVGKLTAGKSGLGLNWPGMYGQDRQQRWQALPAVGGKVVKYLELFRLLKNTGACVAHAPV
ncbi:MAG: hypothetical protein ACYDAI_09275 [Trichloromonadaceae bacterium]